MIWIVRHSAPQHSSPQTFITPYLKSDIHHPGHSSPEYLRWWMSDHRVSQLNSSEKSGRHLYHNHIHVVFISHYEHATQTILLWMHYHYRAAFKTCTSISINPRRLIAAGGGGSKGGSNPLQGVSPSISISTLACTHWNPKSQIIVSHSQCPLSLFGTFIHSAMNPPKSPTQRAVGQGGSQFWRCSVRGSSLLSRRNLWSALEGATYGALTGFGRATVCS